LVYIFISKDEEGFKIEEVTDLYKKEYNIPDSDGLLDMRAEWQKRKRSDIISADSLNKPGSKKPKVDTMKG